MLTKHPLRYILNTSIESINLQFEWGRNLCKILRAIKRYVNNIQVCIFAHLKYALKLYANKLKADEIATVLKLESE